MTLTDPQLDVLADAHIEGQAQVRAAAALAVGRLWDGLGAYDGEHVDTFTAGAAATVVAAQQASVALTNAFLARAMERQPFPLDPSAVIARVRGPATPIEVYRRPFVTTWTSLKNGTPWTDAVAAGQARATSTAATDVQLAMRETLREVGEADDGIYGYQRVPDGGACALCRIASTQRYHVSALMPIHNHCGCGVKPLTQPTGQIINRDVYGEVKADGAIDRITAQRRGADDAPAPAVVVSIREHGELGPVLTDAAHSFDPLAA